MHKKIFASPSLSFFEIFTQGALILCVLVSVFTTLAIIFFLCRESFSFFESVSFKEFFGGTQWTPLIEPKHFGLLPILWGTLLIGVGSSMIAVPLGGCSALFLSEYVQGSLKFFLKSIIEILAGIPSVVYGFFAVIWITPSLKTLFPQIEVFNVLSATIVVGVMTIPTILSISQDAFEAVPKDLREAAYGLGARKYQVATTVVFPAALSGFLAAVILGFSRAIGETMAVTLAAGATPKLTLNLFESIQTMTAYIVQVSLGDTPAVSLEYQTIFAVGLMLFLTTLFFNYLSQWIVGRFSERAG